jgi:ABC-type uncharacterized transport system substrate-binding protein
VSFPFLKRYEVSLAPFIHHRARTTLSVTALRSLVPGLLAITVAASILLLSDLPKSKPAEKKLRVALLQMSSQPIMEEGVEGVIDGLAEGGFVVGQNLVLSRFNAEGDMPTANAMAQEVASPQYDLVITISTPCLQALANANHRGTVKHVFGLVSDPAVAGVGIGAEPSSHPPYMTGIGTLPPAGLSFEMAKQICPELKRVGVVWNPAEANSEVATKMARAACKKLQIELLEANSQNTSEVREAAASLLAREIDALWVGGDITALGAIDVLVTLAKQARIPVFTCMPGNTKRGGLFDVGANYGEVGRKIGLLAARVLDGEDIAAIPWERAIPPRTSLNLTATQGLKSTWSFPATMVEAADSVIDASGEKTKAVAPRSSSEKRLWRLRLISYINSVDTEEAEAGFREGLTGAGLVEGRDFDWKASNAQGDITVLNALADAAVADKADLILTVSTQALQAAVQRAKGIPITFTMVANPFSAGVAKSDQEHLPGVSGAYGSADAKAMMPLLREVLPRARTFGTLYSPGEVNSVFNHDELSAAVKGAGWTLISSGVNTSSEVPDAAQALCGQEIDGLCVTNSNLSGSCFPSLMQACRRSGKPVFGFLGSMSEQGAVLVLTRDYREMGRDSGAIAARIIRGEPVSGIPLRRSVKNRLLVNLDAAKACGIQVPESMIRVADKVIGR